MTLRQKGKAESTSRRAAYLQQVSDSLHLQKANQVFTITDKRAVKRGHATLRKSEVKGERKEKGEEFAQ